MYQRTTQVLVFISKIIKRAIIIIIISNTSLRLTINLKKKNNNAPFKSLLPNSSRTFRMIVGKTNDTLLLLFRSAKNIFESMNWNDYIEIQNFRAYFFDESRDIATHRHDQDKLTDHNFPSFHWKN